MNDKAPARCAVLQNAYAVAAVIRVPQQTGVLIVDGLDVKCIRCDCDMEPCVLKPVGVREAAFSPERTSVVARKPGTKISMNPITAFQQGLRGEPDDIDYPLVAYRCPSCTKVELYAPPS